MRTDTIENASVLIRTDYLGESPLNRRAEYLSDEELQAYYSHTLNIGHSNGMADKKGSIEDRRNSFVSRAIQKEQISRSAILQAKRAEEQVKASMAGINRDKEYLTNYPRSAAHIHELIALLDDALEANRKIDLRGHGVNVGQAVRESIEALQKTLSDVEEFKAENPKEVA